uniref:CCHC-type domain-containing protein n=1 Tax=Astatotilapia calliptera TaxID=8154 RepID=A0AAX7SUA1_ASTCA
MYNPWVSEETIKYFLGRYVTVLPGVRKIKDGLGLWTGKRQFRVKLNVDTSTEDGYCHPPAVFSIGADRGFLVYAGQPQACRKCGSTGHNADRCEQMRCRSCGKIGHITKDCKEPRKCHLCDSETHMARDYHLNEERPQACRKCGSTGHNADRCEQMRCRSCGKIGHITKDCKEPRKCHLCDSETHMARDYVMATL